MTYVRPHVRRDGTYVKGHYRRQRPRAATGPRPAVATRPPATRPPIGRPPIGRPPLPARTGPSTYVHPYVRADGTRVRGHRRSLGPREAKAAGASGFVVLLLVLLALAGGGGDGSAPAGPRPSQGATTAAARQ